MLYHLFDKIFVLQIIMAKAAGGPKPKENKDWDED